mmetsp:Transcript_37967/g.108453  ORF Transcript_37967/g.108453 Transcript_37967/m.108453 type:complete len:209 (-) Transcript_37967:321-947(-)
MWHHHLLASTLYHANLLQLLVQQGVRLRNHPGRLCCRRHHMRLVDVVCILSQPQLHSSPGAWAYASSHVATLEVEPCVPHCSWACKCLPEHCRSIGVAHKVAHPVVKAGGLATRVDHTHCITVPLLDDGGFTSAIELSSRGIQHLMLHRRERVRHVVLGVDVAEPCSGKPPTQRVDCCQCACSGPAFHIAMIFVRQLPAASRGCSGHP